MTDNRQKTCEERIQGELEDRLEDFEWIVKCANEDISDEWVVRSTTEYDDEHNPLYWSNEDGWVDRDSADTFDEDEKEELTLPTDGEWANADQPSGQEMMDREEADERWFEGPLSCDIKRTVVVQMSWGGPSDQFECDVDDDGDIEEIRYRFLDWFDGAVRTLSGDERDTAEAYLQRFVGYATGNY